MLTSYQKENSITAYREQTGRDSPLRDRPTFTFGSLAFGFVIKKDRTLKVGARAIMGIWAGLDKEVDDAHRVVPIVWENEAWTLLPTHGAELIKTQSPRGTFHV